jgi:NADH dehydrogenase
MSDATTEQVPAGIGTRRAARGEPIRIVIAGGGYVGMYTALRLQRKLDRGKASITVIDPRSAMTYQPFLPEAAAGSIEPRHVVVPLRRVLRHCRVLTGRVVTIDHGRRRVTVAPPEGACYQVPYDVVVVGLGSVSRTLPIPGLAEEAFGFKQIDDAIALRNHVLERLDAASSTSDPRIRQRALTFVVVGGGYAGVEALAELEDMARHACSYYQELEPGDLRWVLVEASEAILPEVGAKLGRYTAARLRERGIEVLFGTQLRSCLGGRVVLSDGQAFDADTIVWTAGVRAHPALADTDLPLDERGRIVTLPTLQVRGTVDAWAAGDNAAVPDLTSPGAWCAPNAQHAVRQAKVLADNIVRRYEGRAVRAYRHRYAGSVASLGLHKGVAQVYGIRVRGFPAWFMHRTYHMSKMPTLDRKVRIVLDWTLALLFRREVVSLGDVDARRDESRRNAADADEPMASAPLASVDRLVGA